MKGLITYIVLALFIIILLGTIYLQKNTYMQKRNMVGEVRYVALGDSYTIGEGASQEESWPNVLAKHLQEENIPIKLIANPSVTGWTTQQLIENELPIYDTSNPTFATLLIGVNDWVQGVDKDTFRKNIVIILDRMQSKLQTKDNLIIITIPDFSVTPMGGRYSNGRDSAAGITLFNDIIKDEAQKRNISLVDIFPLSQGMKSDTSLTAQDGLHPSAKEYALWEKEIYPVASKLLQKEKVSH